MKFVHAADTHLDSPLVGLQRYEGAPAEELRGATRRALSNLVELTLEEEAAFLLLAGDLFDGDWKDYSTGLFFLKQMSRLREAGVPVLMVAGNHDAISGVTKSLKLPDSIRQLSHRKPESVVLEDLGVVIHGQSFSTRAVEENLAASYPRHKPGLFNIGLLHTSVNGREGHDNYAPCTVSTLAEKGYQYWALGHVHTREIVSEDPWVVFSGNIQGRNIRETGDKGCTVVTVEDNAVVNVEPRPVDVLRWEILPVKTSATDSPQDVLDTFEEALSKLRRKHGDLPLAVRVRVEGRCAAHRALLANPEKWMAEIRALANSVSNGNVWIEKVKLETSPPIGNSGLSAAEGPMAALLVALDGLSPESDTIAELKTELRDLFGKLPELREQIDLEKEDTVAELAESAKQMLLTHILEEGDVL